MISAGITRHTPLTIPLQISQAINAFFMLALGRTTIPFGGLQQKKPTKKNNPLFLSLLRFIYFSFLKQFEVVS